MAESRIPPFVSTRKQSPQKLPTSLEDQQLVVLAGAVMDAVVDELMERFTKPLESLKREVALVKNQNSQAEKTLTKELPVQVKELVSQDFSKEKVLYEKDLATKSNQFIGEILDKEFNRRVGSLVKYWETRLIDLETGQPTFLEQVKSLQQEELGKHEKQLKTLFDTYEKQLVNNETLHKKQLQDLVGTYEKQLQNVQDKHEKHFESMRSFIKALPTPQVVIPPEEIDKQKSRQLAYEKQLESLQQSVNYYQKQLSDTQDAHRQQLDELKQFILALPIPQISVPTDAIKIEQSTPQVFVPPDAIRINQVPSIINYTPPEQQASIVHVNVPEQRAPDVHVNIPEQKAPDVHVNVPPAKKIRKDISYDEYGRPVLIREREEEELTLTPE